MCPNFGPFCVLDQLVRFLATCTVVRSFNRALLVFGRLLVCMFRTRPMHILLYVYSDDIGLSGDGTIDADSITFVSYGGHFDKEDLP